MAWNSGQYLFGGRYIIERKLGEGGVGITYLAKNRRGELRVIKTLREQILNDPKWIPHQDKLRQDFRDEALRLALCRHTHIVQVENVFDEENLPCMAMEYIEGEDLGKRITEKGALPEAEALEYIRQIGEALTVVHERGLLHRDLKPSNIMMRVGKQEAVLIDFGLARQFIPGAVQLHTESLTPGYAPPEQYAPDAERGEYIDVYALAATLYSLLSGQLPMPAPARLQNFTMRSPKELNSSVSDKVNNAIMRGMALNYKFRPHSVQEFLDLLLAAVVVVSDNWECVHIIRDIDGSFALSPSGEILATVAANTINVLEFASGKLIRTVTLRDFDNVSPSHSVFNVFLPIFVFSPDMQILARSSYGGTIIIWEVQTGKLRNIMFNVTEYPDYGLVFSPDGRTLASGSDEKTIKIWEVETGKEIRTITGLSWPLYAFAFSPDGRTLASGSGDKTIKIWEVQTGKEICTLSGHSDWVHSVVFSPEGRILASVSKDKTIKIWEVQTGKEIRTLSGHSDSVYSVVFSPDGRTLASVSRDKTIKIWEVQTGKEIRTLSGHSDSVYSVVFSPNGQTLASGSNDGTIRIWRRS